MSETPNSQQAAAALVLWVKRHQRWTLGCTVTGCRPEGGSTFQLAASIWHDGMCFKQKLCLWHIGSTLQLAASIWYDGSCLLLDAVVVCWLLPDAGVGPALQG